MVLSSIVRIVRFMYGLIVVPSVILFTVIVAHAENDTFPSESVLPAGTLVFVPKLIMEEFKRDSKLWNKPCSYLSRYYSFAGPSLSEEDQDGESTYYYPLSQKNGKNGELASDFLMIDIMNLQFFDEENCIFITRYDVSLDELNILYNHFIGNDSHFTILGKK